MKKIYIPAPVRLILSSIQKSSSVCSLFKRTSYLLLLVLLIPSLSWSQGFKISGTQLRDANGNNFIMKGFSVPTAWFTGDVNNNIANIRSRTNANCLRIVVTTGTSDNAWQTSVQNCIANSIIPMVELHDVTGSNSASDLQRMANFWASKASFFTRSDISKYILINIANEWGDWFMSSPTNDPSGTVWRDAYINAVRTLRNVGINTTLVVDAPGYGQDNKANTLLSYAPAVQSGDPQHNVLFSVHMYCEWTGNSSITTHLPAIKNAGIPIIVGEFGFQHSEGSGICDINEAQIMSTAQSNGIGWLAWSWKGNGSPVQYLDLSNDWGGTSLTGWGNTVVNGANGTKTASTASVFTGGGGGGGGTAITNGTYRITARHSGKSLDVAGSSTADGGNVIQWAYGGGNNQRWFVQDLGGGAFSIRSVNSNKALDVVAASTADGADINQWTYSGNNNQRWRIESLGSGYYRIVSVNSSKCVDVVSSSTADGAAIQQWGCSGGNNQSFTFEKLSSATSRLEETEEISFERSINVYPNPSTGSFTISEPGAFNYVIRNSAGSTIEIGKGKNQAIVGSNFAQGFYLIQVQTLKGRKQAKLIKN